MGTEILFDWLLRRIAFLNLDNESNFLIVMSSLFHSLTVEGIIGGTIADNDLINLSVKDSISTPSCDLIESIGEFQQINEFEHVCLAAELDDTCRKVDFSKQNIKDLQRLDDNLLPMINYLEKGILCQNFKKKPVVCW